MITPFSIIVDLEDLINPTPKKQSLIQSVGEQSSIVQITEAATTSPITDTSITISTTTIEALLDEGTTPLLHLESQ